MLVDLNAIWFTRAEAQLHFAMNEVNEAVIVFPVRFLIRVLIYKYLLPRQTSEKSSQAFPYVRRRESRGELLEALDFPVPEVAVSPCQPRWLPVPFCVVHAIAFHFGTLTIRWYGVLVMLGFVAGLWTAGRRGVRDGFAPEVFQDLGVWLIVGTILGARTLYVVSYWKESFAGHPWTEIFKVWEGGLVFYGGLIGASLATIICAQRKKLRLWKLADALAPSISLGYFFGRLGCFMNGCCYGRPTDLPWAVHFPPDNPYYPQGVHPTQLYESFLGLALYAALARLYRRKKFDGQIFAIYLMCYAVLRSFVETLRGDYPVHYLGGWATPAQLVSFGIFTAGLVLYWQLPRREAQPASAQ